MYNQKNPLILLTATLFGSVLMPETMFCNILLAHNHGQRVVNKFTKLSKIGFCMECFTAEFWDFVMKTSEFGFWVSGWVLSIRSKHSKHFLEIS